MKKIKNICLILVCLFVIGITSNVKADTIKYYLSTKGLDYGHVSKDSAKETSVKREDTITVAAVLEYSGSETYKLDKGKLTVRFDNKYLKLLDYSTSNSPYSSISLKSVSNESSKIVISDLTTDENVKSGKNILVEFKFQVLTDAPAGSMKIYQQDGEDYLNLIKQDNDTIKVDSLYTELKYNVSKSTNNKLSSIKIDGKGIDNFSENTANYEIKVDENKEKVTVEATAKDTKAKVSGAGEKSLSYGTNKVTITVTSESGEKNTYNLNIIRNDTRSSINTLKTLELSDGEINFRSNVNDYTVNVENDVEEITITSSLTDAKSKYAEDYSNKTIKLVEGSNKIQIKVISEKGEENIYTINVNRALNSNNSLKSLKVNDEKIELFEDEFTYNYEVENDVDSIVIKAVANDAKATVKLEDKYDLVEGENEIEILVTAASGDKASYILNVNRKKIPSKDSLLKSLTIKGYDIKFKQDVTSYDLTLPKDVEELEITYEVEDENAIVEIEGNKDLIDGSIIKVNVKAEDGTYTRYFINIEKKSGGISPVIIIILIFMLLLGGCLGLLFYRKKKQNKKEEHKKEEDTEIEDEPQEEQPEDKEDEESKEDFSIKKETTPEEEINHDSEPEIERGAHEYTGEHEYTGDDEEEKKDIE